jgi:hypothetical protein
LGKRISYVPLARAYLPDVHSVGTMGIGGIGLMTAIMRLCQSFIVVERSLANSGRNSGIALFPR